MKEERNVTQVALRYIVAMQLGRAFGIGGLGERRSAGPCVALSRPARVAEDKLSYPRIARISDNIRITSRYPQNFNYKTKPLPPIVQRYKYS